MVTIAEHLRRIRKTNPGRRGWGIAHVPNSPPGIHLPAEWIGEEFPELSGNELDPLVQYFCGEGGAVRRRGLFKIERTVVTDFLLWFFYLLYILMLVAMFRPLLSSWPPLFIAMVLIPPAFFLYRGLRMPSNVIPRTPMEILSSTNRTFVEDFALTPISDRDLFVGNIAIAFTERPAMRPLFRLLLLYGAMIGVPYAIFFDVNAAIVGSAFAGYLDFRRECFLGAATRRHAVLSGILPIDIPDPRMKLRYGGRYYNKAVTRRKANAARINAARFIHNLPLGLTACLLVAMATGGFFLPLVWTMMLAPALALFILARSPVPLWFHRASRYVTQWRMRFFVRHMCLHRRHWQRWLEYGDETWYDV